MVNKALHINIASNHLLYPELERALQYAIEVGDTILSIKQKGYEVRDKQGEGFNPVTEADEAASQFLLEHLSQSFPEDAFISEEAPIPSMINPQQRIWYIDPIDGTKEFIKGISEWSVMIGLAINGNPELGVVYQPDLKEGYYAVKGGGAYFFSPNESRRIQVRCNQHAKDNILIQSRSHWCESAQKIAGELGIVQTLKHGSIGLKLGLIAQAKADLYLNFSGHCHLWDTCGPEAILNEAGGKVVMHGGRKLNYHTNETLIKQSFAAGNKGLASQVELFI
jgi:3'(2'), 5'-bisphosphate nucleotidase